MLISHNDHNNTIQVYSVTVMTHALVLYDGQSVTVGARKGDNFMVLKYSMYNVYSSQQSISLTVGPHKGLFPRSYHSSVTTIHFIDFLVVFSTITSTLLQSSLQKTGAYGRLCRCHPPRGGNLGDPRACLTAPSTSQRALRVPRSKQTKHHW